MTSKLLQAKKQDIKTNSNQNVVKDWKKNTIDSILKEKTLPTVLHDDTGPVKKKIIIVSQKKKFTKATYLKLKNTQLPISPVVDNTNVTFNGIHDNPSVGEVINAFIIGENKHLVATCIVCQETRPVFNGSYDDNKTRIKIQPWKLNKNKVCSRCQNDRSKRKKKQNLMAVKIC